MDNITDEILTFKNVTMRYPYEKYDVITDISFGVNVEGNTILNWDKQSGKTTVVKLISGIIKKTSGEILYKGVPIEQIPIEKRNIAVIFSDFAILNRKVDYNITYGLKARGKSKKECKIALNKMASYYELCDIINKNAKKVDAFTQFKIALARADCRKIDLLILDDAFIKLKANEILKAELLIERLKEKQKCAVLRLITKEDLIIAKGD
ncbi:MAG: ATP-binding cassette domain-containing protein [Clostridia bacterium]